MAMKVNRRSFLTSTAAALAAGTLSQEFAPSVAHAASTTPQKFLAGMAPGSLGINIDGFWHTMEAASKVGFHNIEVDNSQLKLAQAYINKTGEFKDRMDKLQLRLVGLNESYSLLDPTKYGAIAEENGLIGKFMHEVGGIYTGPYGPLTNDEELMRKIAQLCNQEGKRLRETNGIKFAYHTHSSLGFRRLMDLTDPRYVNLTTDLGWLARGYSTRGESSPPTDALEVVRAYESRLCTVHMKDWDPNPEYDYNGNHYKGAVTVPGKGIVNFPAVVDFLREAEWTGQWMGEHVGIWTYEFERSAKAVEIYPEYRDYMVNVLHLNLALKV
jgi:sugar phosphate isomerase/epimerase